MFAGRLGFGTQQGCLGDVEDLLELDEQAQIVLRQLGQHGGGTSKPAGEWQRRGRSGGRDDGIKKMKTKTPFTTDRAAKTKRTSKANLNLRNGTSTTEA